MWLRIFLRLRSFIFFLNILARRLWLVWAQSGHACMGRPRCHELLKVLALPSLIFLTRLDVWTGLIWCTCAVLNSRLASRYVHLDGCDKDLLAIARRLPKELATLRRAIYSDAKFTPIGELARLVSTTYNLLVVTSRWCLLAVTWCSFLAKPWLLSRHIHLVTVLGLWRNGALLRRELLWLGCCIRTRHFMCLHLVLFFEWAFVSLLVGWVAADHHRRCNLRAGLVLLVLLLQVNGVYSLVCNRGPVFAFIKRLLLVRGSVLICP